MHIHFIGIGGTAMGSVAVASKRAGHTVSGSDEGVYPPMSTMLENAEILWDNGFDGERLQRRRPDLVVVGNAISRGNPELEVTLNERLPMTSMASLIGTEFIDRNTSIVCTGTHGKTTTSSITAWILEYAQRKPGFLIGGALPWTPSGCRPIPADIHNTRAGVFVTEGDEYDTAFFDKRSKFVHYRPSIVIVNNIEFDHADIFSSIDDISRSFNHLLRIVPQTGVIFANADDPIVLSTVANAPAPVRTVGFGDAADIQVVDITREPSTSKWSLRMDGKTVGPFEISLVGDHNVRNATMATLAALEVGVNIEEVQDALLKLIVPKRRLESIGLWNGCVVIDDFAHHPTAIASTLQAITQKHPKARIHAIFEPRSNTTTRNIFQRELGECWEGATSVCIGPLNRPERYSADERLDTGLITAALQTKDIPALAINTDSASTAWGQDVLDWLREQTQPGDVIALLSNGNLGGLRDLLIKE